MKRPLLYISITLLTAGCKVGPDYQKPEAPTQIAYTEAKEEKTFVPKDEDLVTWWKVFNDPFLDQLLNETVSGNFDYRIALEHVSQARSQYWMQFTDILPEFVFDAQTSRYRASQAFRSSQPPTTSSSTTSTTTTAATPLTPASTTTTSTNSSISGAKLSPTQSFFQLGFDAIWEIDLFGKLQRSADAAHDTLEAMDETSRDVKITVLSEVANTYSLICVLQEKVAVASQIVEADEELLALANDRFRSGIANEQSVESAIATLEIDKANLKVFQTQLKENIYSLSVLLGRDPETLIEPFTIKRPIPMAQGKIPAGIPADLLKRRHDVRAAERTLASATEQVGVAVAQRYPTISLTGSSSSFAANPLQGANAGFTSDKANKLFKNSARIWGIGALFTVPVFDFGKRLAGVELQMAIQREALLSYQKTVIAALQEVEISLATYFNEEERESSYSAAAMANKRNYDLTLNLFKAGLVDYSSVNEAKEIWLRDVVTLTDSKQSLTSALIAVYKSLGGDW